jgi:hypothetical protein
MELKIKMGGRKIKQIDLIILEFFLKIKLNMGGRKGK